MNEPNDATEPATEPTGSPAPPVEDNWKDRYASSSREAMRLKAELDRANGLLEQFARQHIPQRARPEEQLNQLGIPPDPINEMIDQRVNARVNEALAPIARGIEARTQVLARHPDYAKFESDVAQFVQSDPDRAATYDRMFRADPAGAIEYALLAYGDNQRRNGRAPRESRSDSVHAQIPSQPSGQSRQQPDGGLRRIEEARKRFEQEGTADAARAYAKARLGMAIPDEFFNQ